MRTSSSPASGRRTCATSPPLIVLGLILQDGQPLRPHVLDERPELLDPLGPEAVDPLRAVATFGDEAGLLEHGEVLADGRTRDLGVGGDLAGGHLALADEQEDLPAAWFRDGPEGGLHAEQAKPNLRSRQPPGPETHCAST